MTSHLYCNSCWGNTGLPWLKITEVFPSGGKQLLKKLSILFCFTALTPTGWTEPGTVLGFVFNFCSCCKWKTDQLLLATQPLHPPQSSVPIKTASGLWHVLRKQSFSSTLLSLSWVLPGSEKPGELLRPGIQTLLLANHLQALPAPLLSVTAKISAAKSIINTAHQVVHQNAVHRLLAACEVWVFLAVSRY